MLQREREQLEIEIKINEMKNEVQFNHSNIIILKYVNLS
jgi:hypothetical protein